MPNSYRLPLNIEPRELGSEILIAELGETAFESFTETETGISARTKGLWDENDFRKYPNFTIRRIYLNILLQKLNK
jgi:hypothetical protein